MHRSVWLVAPFVLALGAFVLLAVFHPSFQGTYATSGLALGICQSGEQIGARERAAIGDAALEFMETFARSPLEARQLMSRRGRAATMNRADVEAPAQTYNSITPNSQTIVSETYVLRFTGGSNSGEIAPCALEGGRAVFIARGGTMTSGVVLLKEAFTGQSERTISVWLENEGGVWRVRAMQFAPTRLAGMDAAQLWNLAREQRARGHDFNATVLYGLARFTNQLGPYYQSRMMQDFNADVGTFAAAPLLQGSAPYHWTLDGSDYSVTRIEYVGTRAGETVLVIHHSTPNWTTFEEAELINRRLIDSFNSTHPEWREIANALAARAYRPGSDQSWGTVYGRENGFLENTPPAQGSPTQSETHH